MKVSETGEFMLINLIRDLILKNNKFHGMVDNKLFTGIGDDCAVWRSSGNLQLSTTDSMVQDVHFNLNYTSWNDLGYKSIAINLSDIAAMGGVPQYAFISLAINPGTEVEHILDLYKGMIKISNKYGVLIAGGNISSADKLSIHVTVHGYSKLKTVLTRSSAKPGDKIAVTGYTGLSAAGLTLLKKNLKTRKNNSSIFINAHLRPEPRINEGQLLLDCGVKTAIDISDGLLADLGHICEASNVSATIEEPLLPVYPALKNAFKYNYLNLLLGGGEDYELLLTADNKVMKKVKTSLSCPVTIIGEIIKRGKTPVKISGININDTILKTPGWDHFK